MNMNMSEFELPVSPWLQTTFEPDVNRRPLEMGISPLNQIPFK